LTTSQFDQLMQAVKDNGTITPTWQSARIDPVTGQRSTAEVHLGTYLSQIDKNVAETEDLVRSFNPDAFAQAVVDKLTAAGVGTGPTVEQIGVEVEKRLRAVLGSLNDVTP